MAIKLLDDNVINKIAAGEVIERPASVIKELLENSIDAASQNIAVKIAGGGLDSIAVADDGEGISMEELPLAFLRHATSKIEHESDLLQVASMGFRGEALPSIAAVSRIDIYSKKEENDGIHASIEGGKILDLQYYPCPEGSKIVIADLFFNTPARKKFLRSPATEGNNAYELVLKYGLARPDIAISFSTEKKQLFRTPGNGSLSDAVIAIFGGDFREPLIPVKWEGMSISVSGLISPPGVTRTNRKRQMLFVNQRPIRSPLLYRALDEGYRGLLLAREQPLVILQLSLPPDTIDVNVHPQKNEIRFSDESKIFRVLCGLLRDTLNARDYYWQDSLPRSHRTNYRADEGKTGINSGSGAKSTGYMAEAGTEIRPMVEGQPVIPFKQDSRDYGQVKERAGEDWQPSSPGQQTFPAAAAGTGYEEFKIIGQLWDSYILLEMENSFYIVDQHAAHERIIYAELLQYYADSRNEAQLLAFPLNIDLSLRDMESLEENLAVFAELGFVLQPAGPQAIFLRAAPAIAAGKEREVIFEILELLSGGRGINLKNEAIIKMACKKAVKAGERLNNQEMISIIRKLLACEDYKNCPHGRPTIIAWKQGDLERMFKR